MSRFMLTSLAAVGLTLAVACGASVGDTCSTDSDCATGDVCVSLTNLESSCGGRVCTNTCSDSEDCTAFDGGDCETVGDDRLCLFGEWEDETFCE